jgi:hypothetical protein
MPCRAKNLFPSGDEFPMSRSPQRNRKRVSKADRRRALELLAASHDG